MKKAATCLIVIGIIFLIVGSYFIFILAGLPYPDPTPEMIEKWMHYYNLGRTIMPIGTVMAIIGIALKAFAKK